MAPSRTVLKPYEPMLDRLQWERAPAGFSGAEVWKGSDGGEPIVAFKQWPAGFSARRLADIHRWMSQAKQLSFVPAVLNAMNGETIVVEDDRLWDLTRWMTGTPLERPSVREIETACAAVAKLHVMWRTDRPPEACRGIRNRLRLLREWISSPSPVDPSLLPELKSLVRRAIGIIGQTAPLTIEELSSWEDFPLAVQPCVRDLRGEHVLFAGNRVTGIVDYGAMAEDNPAVDLARLLGDYCLGDPQLFAAGLASYRAAGAELDTPDCLVGQLARSGALGSAIIWLRRLCSPDSTYPVTDAATTRFAHLVRQIEQFAPT
jgi:homoserine kinase type II